jgi:hypothetical protein
MVKPMDNIPSAPEGCEDYFVEFNEESHEKTGTGYEVWHIDDSRMIIAFSEEQDAIDYIDDVRDFGKARPQRYKRKHL